jgi:hypothetical protein
MLNLVEIDLITAYEEVHEIEKSQCITEYYGDLSIHTIKTGVSDVVAEQRLYAALDDIELTREEFNNLVEKEKFMSRANITKYFKKHSKNA